MPYDKNINFISGDPAVSLATEIGYARPTGFRLSIDRLKYPNAEFNVQLAGIPDISAEGAPMALPKRNLAISPDKITYSPLQITFLIDEELINYTEIHDWILGQVTESDDNILNKTRDMSLLIESSHNNVVKEIQFVDAYPTSLSSLIFDVRNTDMDYLAADASFEYSYFKVK